MNKRVFISCIFLFFFLNCYSYSYSDPSSSVVTDWANKLLNFSHEGINNKNSSDSSSGDDGDSSGDGSSSSGGTSSSGSSTPSTSSNSIVTNVANTINNVTQGVNNVSSNISNSVSNFTQSANTNSLNILNKLSSSVNAVKTSFNNSNVVSNIKTNVDSIVDTTKSTMSNVYSNVDNYLTSNDIDISSLKESIESKFDDIKSGIVDTASNVINSFDNQEIMTRLKDSINLGVGDFLLKHQLPQSESMKAISDEFIAIGGTIVANYEGASAADIATMVVSNEELKKQTEALLNEKINLMSSLGASQEQIDQIKEIYNSTLGNTFEKIASGDHVGAKADLIAKQEEFSKYFADQSEALKNHITENQNELTDKILDKTNLSDSETGDFLKQMSGSINSGEMVSDLLGGDLDGAKQELFENVDDIKELAVNKTDEFVKEQQEKLSNELLDKVGLSENEAANNFLGNVLGGFNIGGMAESLFSGDIDGLKEQASEGLSNAKDQITSEKIGEVLSSAMADKGYSENVTNSIKNIGESMKNSVANSNLGMTAVGDAMNQIIESAVSNGNEGALLAVNNILYGNVEEGITALKSSGLDIMDNSIITSVKLAESLIEPKIEAANQIVDNVYQGVDEKLDNVNNYINDEMNKTQEIVNSTTSSIAQKTNDLAENFSDNQSISSNNEAEEVWDNQSISSNSEAEEVWDNQSISSNSEAEGVHEENYYMHESHIKYEPSTHHHEAAIHNIKASNNND